MTPEDFQRELNMLKQKAANTAGTTPTAITPAQNPLQIPTQKLHFGAKQLLGLPSETHAASSPPSTMAFLPAGISASETTKALGENWRGGNWSTASESLPTGNQQNSLSRSLPYDQLASFLKADLESHKHAEYDRVSFPWLDTQEAAKRRIINIFEGSPTNIQELLEAKAILTGGQNTHPQNNTETFNVAARRMYDYLLDGIDNKIAELGGTGGYNTSQFEKPNDVHIDLLKNFAKKNPNPNLLEQAVLEPNDLVRQEKYANRQGGGLFGDTKLADTRDIFQQYPEYPKQVPVQPPQRPMPQQPVEQKPQPSLMERIFPKSTGLPKIGGNVAGALPGMTQAPGEGVARGMLPSGDHATQKAQEFEQVRNGLDKRLNEYKSGALHEGDTVSAYDTLQEKYPEYMKLYPNSSEPIKSTWDATFKKFLQRIPDDLAAYELTPEYKSPMGMGAGDANKHFAVMARLSQINKGGRTDKREMSILANYLEFGLQNHIASLAHGSKLPSSLNPRSVTRAILESPVTGNLPGKIAQLIQKKNASPALQEAWGQTPEKDKEQIETYTNLINLLRKNGVEGNKIELNKPNQDQARTSAQEANFIDDTIHEAQQRQKRGEPISELERQWLWDYARGRPAREMTNVQRYGNKYLRTLLPGKF